jgi:hypothetical protein
MSQLSLFGGYTYDHDLDEQRLTGQLKAVYQVMRDGQWRTLKDIAAVTHAMTGKRFSEAAISARLRDFRKPKFGGHLVDRRRVGVPKSGLFQYRLEVNK